MDLVTVSQNANPILQTLFITVIGLVYYYTVSAARATVREKAGQGHLLRVPRACREL